MYIAVANNIGSLVTSHKVLVLSYLITPLSIVVYLSTNINGI